jgi:periplasmic protein CpxP/Spy
MLIAFLCNKLKGILMMKRKLFSKKLAVITALAIALPFSALSHAEPVNKSKYCQHGGERGHFQGKGQHSKMGVPPYLMGLDLTEAQQDKVFAIMHAEAPSKYEGQKQHRKLIEELRTLSQADSFDQAKANLISDQLAKLEKDKALNMATSEAKVFALLTPEQRKKAREFKMQEPGFNHGFGRGKAHDVEPTRFKTSGHQPNSYKS